METSPVAIQKAARTTKITGARVERRREEGWVILRPSRAHGLLSAMLNVVKTMIASFNRVFYGNWDMIK